MHRVYSKEWNEDCERWRGRLLVGRFAHWCYNHDGLPVDETCNEFPCYCLDQTDYCTWEQDDEGNYATSCGQMFVFNEGTASENDVKYCSYCGNFVEDIPYEDRSVVFN